MKQAIRKREGHLAVAAYSFDVANTPSLQVHSRRFGKKNLKSQCYPLRSLVPGRFPTNGARKASTLLSPSAIFSGVNVLKSILSRTQARVTLQICERHVAELRAPRTIAVGFTFMISARDVSFDSEEETRTKTCMPVPVETLRPASWTSTPMNLPAMSGDEVGTAQAPSPVKILNAEYWPWNDFINTELQAGHSYFRFCRWCWPRLGEAAHSLGHASSMITGGANFSSW